MLFEIPLPTPQRTHYTRLGIGPEATPDEIREALNRYTKRIDEQEREKAHAVQLDREEDRAAYDAQHPPLELLRLDPTWAGFFEDRMESLVVLRRDVEEFLARQNVTVHRPSDLTRSDFTDDFTYSPLLDGPERP